MLWIRWLVGNVLAILCMLGSTAICSTVFFAGSGTRILAPSSQLQVDGGLTCNRWQMTRATLNDRLLAWLLFAILVLKST